MKKHVNHNNTFISEIQSFKIDYIAYILFLISIIQSIVCFELDKEIFTFTGGQAILWGTFVLYLIGKNLYSAFRKYTYLECKENEEPVYIYKDKSFKKHQVIRILILSIIAVLMLILLFYWAYIINLYYSDGSFAYIDLSIKSIYFIHLVAGILTCIRYILNLKKDQLKERIPYSESFHGYQVSSIQNGMILYIVELNLISIFIISKKIFLEYRFQERILFYTVLGMILLGFILNEFEKYYCSNYKLFISKKRKEKQEYETDNSR